MEKSKAVLHGYWRSGCSWRLRIVMNLKGIEYEYIPVNLVEGKQRSEEYLKMNPSGMVPTLLIDDLVMSESMPICEYFEECYKDHGKTLLPQGDDKESAKKRFQIRRLCEIINSGTQPIQNLGVLKRIEGIGGDKVQWGKDTIVKGLTTFESFVSETKGKYCVGDDVSLADTFLIPQLYNANRFGVDVKGLFPNTFEISENLEQLPEFVSAHCDN